METRNAKLIINKSGGTASEKSKTYRVTIPNSWIEQLGLNENYRDVELAFDGDKIIINKTLDINSFIESRRSHKLLRLDYYNFKNLTGTAKATIKWQTLRFKVCHYFFNSLLVLFTVRLDTRRNKLCRTLAVFVDVGFKALISYIHLTETCEDLVCAGIEVVSDTLL